MAISPTVRRRRLGSEIKRLRDGARMSGGTLAKKIGTSQPQLSRVENARGQLTAAQLDKLIKVFNVDERKAEEMRTLRRDGDVLGWWEQYSDVMPDNVELLIGLEAGAAWEQTYQDAFIPGLLQTPEYAKAVISSAAPYLRSADLPRLVQLRTDRQQRLTATDFRYTAVINEAALHRWIGGRGVMHAQLRHLLDTRHNAAVEVQVLPYEAGEHPAQGQSFVLLTFPEPEDPAIVFLDYAHSSGFLEKAPEIRQHTSVFGAVTAKALDPDDSMRKIADIAATFT
ncbi:MAG TPA: helix-turn-helix transcriptional regulator [Pseudonocardiaceae bacterium]|nr:helix-turn-helix transcriptional regulator [Pseudonocardiaceae bacterium]